MRIKSKMHRLVALTIALAMCVSMMPGGVALAGPFHNDTGFRLTFEADPGRHQDSTGHVEPLYAAVDAPVTVVTKNVGTVTPDAQPWEVYNAQGVLQDTSLYTTGTTPGGERFITVRSTYWGAWTVVFKYTQNGVPMTDSVEIKYCQITHTKLCPESGRTQLLWDENLKTFVHKCAHITETVFGKCPSKDGGFFENLPLYGATVSWKIKTSPIWDSAAFISTETVTDADGEAEASFTSNATGISKIDVQAGYQLDNMSQYPVALETAYWTWFIEELVKVPQVRWAGEEIVLEKKFGTSYAGQPVKFILENQSPGGFEDLAGTSQAVWTCVDKDGVARANFISEVQGQVDAEAILFSCEPDVTLGSNLDAELASGRLQIINKHGFVVFYLQLEDAYLGNVQAGTCTASCVDADVVHGLDRVCDDDGITKDTTNNTYTFSTWWGDAIDPIDLETLAGGEVSLNPVEVTIPGKRSLMNQYPNELMKLGSNPPSCTTDDNIATVLAKDDQLLRTRVRGYFTTADSVSARPVRDQNNLVLPAGRWVLPDDWAILAMGNADVEHWDQFRAEWDLHDDICDSIFGSRETGPFGHRQWSDFEQEMNFIRPWSDVIGPYNPLICNTIIDNGVLNWMDCPMPPAKMSIKILDKNGNGLSDEPGYLTKADKGKIYWAPMITEFDSCSDYDLGKAYIAPFYKAMVPSNKRIPPFINNGGYDWDSFGFSRPADGPYDFWSIFNTDWSWRNKIANQPKEVQVYSDEHGEAMVTLKGANFTLPEPNGLGGIDILPYGATVGTTKVTAFADYPYLRKHPPVQTNYIEKTWKSEWRKELHAVPWSDDGTQWKVIASLQDIYGEPIAGERLDWSITDNPGLIVQTNPDKSPAGVSPTISSNKKDAVTYTNSDGESWIIIHNNNLDSANTNVHVDFNEELVKRDLVPPIDWEDTNGSGSAGDTEDNEVTLAFSSASRWNQVAAPSGTQLSMWTLSYNAAGQAWNSWVNGNTTANLAANGVGYWGYGTTPVVVTLNSPTATSPYNVALAYGWNLVGNPFAKSAQIGGTFYNCAWVNNGTTGVWQLNVSSIPAGHAAWVYCSNSGGATLTLTETP